MFIMQSVVLLSECEHLNDVIVIVKKYTFETYDEQKCPLLTRTSLPPIPPCFCCAPVKINCSVLVCMGGARFDNPTVVLWDGIGNAPPLFQAN